MGLTIRVSVAEQVRVCRERSTGKVYAMKKLKKSEMVRRGQIDHVKAERNVLAEVHNPYIVKLLYSFQVCSKSSSTPTISMAPQSQPLRAWYAHGCARLIGCLISGVLFYQSNFGHIGRKAST